MNVYLAILSAADYIKRNPKDFNVLAIGVPEPECGTHGCALGWIGYFLGVPTRHNNFDAKDILDPLNISSDEEFYRRMQIVAGETLDSRAFGKWSKSAEACAAALRLYAEKYHAAEKPSMITTPRELMF